MPRMQVGSGGLAPFIITLSPQLYTQADLFPWKVSQVFIALGAGRALEKSRSFGEEKKLLLVPIAWLLYRLSYPVTNSERRFTVV